MVALEGASLVLRHVVGVWSGWEESTRLAATFAALTLAFAALVHLLSPDDVATAPSRARAAEEAELEHKRSYLPKQDFFSTAELALYDGTDPEKPIVLAAGGRVFNVSAGRRYYGEGGVYHSLAGKDATRLLAKGILEESVEEAKAPLTFAEELTLRDWREHFAMKYDTLGSFVEAVEKK